MAFAVWQRQSKLTVKRVAEGKLAGQAAIETGMHI